MIRRLEGSWKDIGGKNIVGEQCWDCNLIKSKEERDRHP